VARVTPVRTLQVDGQCALLRFRLSATILKTAGFVGFQIVDKNFYF
jgi:hypothetical protein